MVGITLSIFGRVDGFNALGLHRSVQIWHDGGALSAAFILPLWLWRILDLNDIRVLYLWRAAARLHSGCLQGQVSVALLRLSLGKKNTAQQKQHSFYDIMLIKIHPESLIEGHVEWYLYINYPWVRIESRLSPWMWSIRFNACRRKKKCYSRTLADAESRSHPKHLLVCV